MHVIDLQANVVIKVMSVCYFSVLLFVITQHDLNNSRLNDVIFLEINIRWVGSMLLTPEFLQECV